MAIVRADRGDTEGLTSPVADDSTYDPLLAELQAKLDELMRKCADLIEQMEREDDREEYQALRKQMSELVIRSGTA